MLERGLVARDEIEAGKPLCVRQTGGKNSIRTASPPCLHRGGPTERKATRAAQFAAGDRVRAKIIHPPTHALPHYVRGHVGIIERVLGCHVFPDSATGAGENPQWLYTVTFDGAELWSEASNPELTVSVTTPGNLIWSVPDAARPAGGTGSHQGRNQHPRDEDGPVFREPWEAHAFAMALALHARRLFTWNEWAAALADQIKRAQAEGDPDTGETYYQHWLATLETLVAAKGVARRMSCIATAMPQGSTPPTARRMASRSS